MNGSLVVHGLRQVRLPRSILNGQSSPVTCQVRRYQAEEEAAGTGGLEVRFGSIPCGCVSLECYAKE